jgi:hypothetical protein
VIAIDNILVSDMVVEEKFACDLHKCKGGCCEDGDAGAPLENDEKETIRDVYEKVKPYLTKEGIQEIEQNGFYRYDKSFGWVTPTIEGKICAYGFRNKSGIIKCAFEQAYHDGLIDWKKPISCHLYPIRIKKSKHNDIEYVNYEPREEMCHPACVLGKKIKLPAYVFLKEGLIRKYGRDFYTALEATAKHLEQQND